MPGQALRRGFVAGVVRLVCDCRQRRRQRERVRRAERSGYEVYVQRRLRRIQ